MLDQTKYTPISILQSSLTEQSVMVDCPSQEDKTAILQSYSTDRADELLASNQSQIDRLIPIRHPNIQPVIDVFVEEENLHIVTGAVGGKPVATQVPLSEEGCEKLLKTILPVLIYLQERGITHGNISPHTLLLQADRQPILTHFQVITELIIAAGGEVHTPISQQLREIPVANIPSGQQFDLYSLGVTTIYLLSDRELKHLYDPNTQQWQWKNHLRPSNGKLLRAIERLLNTQPTSAAEVLQELQTQSRLILDTPPPSPDLRDTTSNVDTSTQTTPTNTRFNHPTPTSTPPTQPGNKSLPTLLTVGAIGGLMMFLGISIGKNNVKPTAENSSVSVPIDRNPSAVTSSGGSLIKQNTPEDLIAQYYKEINSRQYQAAWDRLPPNLQEDRNLHPNGYQSFVDFFNSFSGVRVNNLTAIERNDSRAIVNADLYCQFQNGRQSPLFLRFFLNWNNNNQQWQISKIKLDPDRQSSCGNDSQTTPTPPISSSSTNLTSNDASNLISQWLEAKKSLFGPNYRKSSGENLTTGLAYERNITSNPGTEESSVDDLSRNDMYYTYDNQQVHEIREMRPIGFDEVKVTAIVSEQRTLHNPRKGSATTSFSNRSKSCYQFKKVGDLWKISKTPELFNSCP